METTLNSTAGIIPMLLSLIGVLVALQYLKGMSDFSDAIRYIFWGFVFVFLSKVLIFVSRMIGLEYYFFGFLLFHLWSAVLLTAGASGIRGGNFFNKTIIFVMCLLAGVWSWYVVIITRDAGSFTVSLAASVAGYCFLAASLWRKKMLRNSVGFVITGWFSVFLTLYNLITLMSWGKSLASPAFETFLYIAIMCGWILISNNLMAHQFDTLEQEAEESKERLRLMIQMSPFPIIISRLKDDQLMLINNKAGALFGLDVKHPGNFKTVDYFAEPEKRKELLTKLEKHPVVDDFEFLVKPRKGEPFWLLLSARVIDFEYEIALYMAFQDITDRKKKEMQLFDQATRDPLTKCYNRRQFDELAKKEIQRSRRYNHPFCLFMIDADHFKNVNDTHGHAVGDLVLQALADCCRRTLRESDIVARFGGEEFVILLPESTIENAFRVAERLRIKISKLVVKNEQNQNVQFTVSIGLVSSTVTDDIPEMLKMADESLYVAKENGRNQVVVYEETGPNKDLPRPEGEDIEKAKAEPLYYFKPSSSPVIMNRSDEDDMDTGVVGLSGDKSDDDISLDDDDDEVQHSSGVSLNSLYDDDDDDGAPSFVPTSKPVAPPVPVASPFATGEGDEDSDLPISGLMPPDGDDGDDAFSMPPAFDEGTDEPDLISDGESLSDDDAFSLPPSSGEEIGEEEPDLPPDDEPLPDEDAFSPPPAFERENVVETDEADLPLDDEPLPDEDSEQSLSSAGEPLPPAIAEYPEVENNIPTLSIPENDDELLPEENHIDPVPREAVPVKMPVMPPPIGIPAVKAPMIKMPMLKKMPIKMPPGMVKMPKMPGVVRVKIPKALHQGEAPLPPKPASGG